MDNERGVERCGCQFWHGNNDNYRVKRVQARVQGGRATMRQLEHHGVGKAKLTSGLGDRNVLTNEKK